MPASLEVTYYILSNEPFIHIPLLIILFNRFLADRKRLAETLNLVAASFRMVLDGVCTNRPLIGSDKL